MEHNLGASAAAVTLSSSPSRKRTAATAALNDGDDDRDEEEMDPLEELMMTLHDDEDDEANETMSHADDDSDEEEEETDDAKRKNAFVEPSYENFGSILFYNIAKSMQGIWQSGKGQQHLKKKKKKKGPTLPQKLQAILPTSVLEESSQPLPENSNNAPQSIFPLMRLLCPDKDGSRRTFAKEATLAKMYIDAFGWTKEKKEAKMLLHYTDPHFLGSLPAGAAGDFSVVLHHVLNGDTTANISKANKSGAVHARVPTQPSKMTVADINKALDELASLAGSQSRHQKTNHDWNRSSTGAPSRKTQSSPNKKEKPASVAEKRAAWMKRFLGGGDRRLSPVEHKWLVRILKEEVKFGLGFDKLLTWYHPDGPALFSGHNSLKAVCNALCQADMQAKRQARRPKGHPQDPSHKQKMTIPPYMSQSPGEVQLGKPCTPMFSQRTGFQRILTDISDRHRKFSKKPDYGLLVEEEDAPRQQQQFQKALRSLAMKNPVFSIETKLDGDRMLIHYHAQGELVKIHSRRGIWYSDHYSSVLGPVIRKAVGHWGVDLILDGEVLAWDDGNKETIPFGNNRTVAKLRHDWMKLQGLLDDRDRDLHKNDGDDGTKVFTKEMDWSTPGQSQNIPDTAGQDCWIQFIAFDILYVGGGEKAKDLLSSTVSPFLRDQVEPGSIIHLDGLERKKLLYRIITPVPNKVEIVMTTIVRPNGKSADGKDYFSFENPIQEFGHPAHLLDSITAAFNGAVPNLKEIDEKRCFDKGQEEISQDRSNVVNELYTNIVEKLFLEGLLFKDLSTPYVLDNMSRLLQYWHKFKPDYFNGSVASDLDLVIVGAYFATGLRNSGRPSSFLCACMDPDETGLFYPVVKVNGGSISHNELTELLKETGFKSSGGGSEIEIGSWTRNDNEIPSYIAPWKPAKKERPDMWLDPNDLTIVLTLNAGEITEGPAFPLNITLRFPRITRVRFDKGPDEIETSRSLHEILDRVIQERAQEANAYPEKGASTLAGKSKFLTEKQYDDHKKGSLKKSRKTVVAARIASDPKILKSNTLRGLRFSVLDGNFVLEGMDKEEAKNEGWIESVSSIRNKEDIESFIKHHGGSVILSADEDALVLGGHKGDMKVRGHVSGIEHARMQPKPKAKNPTQKSLRYQKMALGKGVVRWTFPFRLVALAESRKEGSIENETDLKDPNTLDYLARPITYGSDHLRELGDIENIFMMRRALELVQDTQRKEKSKRKEKPSEWYRACHTSLEPSDLWVLSTGNEEVSQSFWPGMLENNAARELVVFPNVSDIDPSATRAIGEESIISVLPLLRVYGATIEDKLTDKVTHVISELQPEMDIVEYRPRGAVIDPLSTFADGDKGKELLDKLDLLFLLAPEDSDVCVWIVSPSWAREKCQNRWE